MPPKGDAYNIDWVFSTASNVHVANHRDWFSTFVPFKISTDSMEAIGAGIVELPVETPDGYSALVLKNVLFCPSYICNIIGFLELRGEGYTASLGSEERLYKVVEGGGTMCAGIFDSPVLPRLRLVGYSDSQTSLNRGANYWINAFLPDQEELARLKKAVSEAEVYTDSTPVV